MAILLLFYKWTIEDVVMHKFKRVYLLGALILSLLIPISPTGYSYSTESSNSMERTTPLTLIEEFTINTDQIEPVFSLSLPMTIAVIFILISVFYFVQFSRNIISLIRKASKNNSRAYRTTRLVLVEEIIAPYTFLDKIYINKQEYLDGHINEELLTHEKAHADQRHSLDVIFIEFLICIFWFNPLLKMYKQCIQLNHEFLADEVVINKYQQVKNYQYLLLDTIKNNNQISLASSINFSLTKKRLEMMTKNSTARRKNLLVLSTLPMILILLVAFGRPATAQSDTKTETTLEQDQNLLRDSYFKEAMVHYTDIDGNSYVKKYDAIPGDIKSKMMPPPPPPAIPGGKSKWANSLEKGTIVSVKNDGSIIIGGNGNVPPPPPKVAKVIKVIKAVKATKATKAPKPPKAVKAPKPSKSVKASKAVKATKVSKAVKAPNKKKG